MIEHVECFRAKLQGGMFREDLRVNSQLPCTEPSQNIA
jgi:hypothetical protein